MNLLYRGLGIIGYPHVCSEYSGDKAVYRLRQDRHRMGCPQCRPGEMTKRGGSIRHFLFMLIDCKSVFVEKKILKGTRLLLLENKEEAAMRLDDLGESAWGVFIIRSCCL